MVHNEIHAIDLTIVGVYLVAMVLIGLVVVKKVRSMDDYYLGGCFFEAVYPDGHRLCNYHRRQRFDGARGRRVFERLQGDYDGATVSARHVYLFRLCRT